MSRAQDKALQDENAPRESFLVLGCSRNLECKLIRLLDSAIVSMIARIIQLEYANARNEHLDAIDRVLSAIVLQRVDRGVKHPTRSFSQGDDEFVPRICGIVEADTCFAMWESL